MKSIYSPSVRKLMQILIFAAIGAVVGGWAGGQVGDMVGVPKIGAGVGSVLGGLLGGIDRGYVWSLSLLQILGFAVSRVEEEWSKGNVKVSSKN